MRNRNNLRKVCYSGMILIIIGQVSFSNHPAWGDIITLAGAATVVTMKIVLWRTRSKTV